MPSAPSYVQRTADAGGPSEPAGPGSGTPTGSLTRPGLRRWPAGRDGAGVARRGPGPLPGRGRRRGPAWPSGVWWFSPIAQVAYRTASFRREGRRPRSGRYGPRGGGPVTLPPGSPGTGMLQSPPRALPRTLSTGVSMTSVTIDSVTSFYSLRGRSHDRLARTACGSRSNSPATPALLSSGYLLVALALLMLSRPRSMVGWPAP